MPRCLRNDEFDATFHITSRVNWQHWHLASEKTAEIFLRLLGRTLERFGLDLVGFCEMSDHVHLVLRSPALELFLQLTSRRTKCRHIRPYPRRHPKASVMSQAMRWLMHTSSCAIQEALDLKGHFWEDRYYAVRIEDADHLAKALAYDHLNPVKQGMVQRAEDFPRSSAAWWAGFGDSPLPLVTRPLPFGLELEDLRRDVLAYQDGPGFRAALEQLSREGRSLASLRGRKRLEELLEQQGVL